MFDGSCIDPGGGAARMRFWLILPGRAPVTGWAAATTLKDLREAAARA